jgi:quaternary ammonium compound-resistance protein SugE
MAWVYLMLAGFCEIGWMLGLRFSEGFSRLNWSIAMLAAMGLSMLFLSYAIRTIPMGTAYAVWTGIGAAGIAVIGMLLFSEPQTLLRIFCLSLVIAGIIGLKIVGQ